MNRSVDVSIEWDTKKIASVPQNGIYSTVAKFDEDVDWQNEAWSILLRFDPPKSGSITSKGRAEFLMLNGPYERLKKGCTFEMYEGRNRSAIVTVL